MNREQILISLRELREQLPVDLINSDYSEQVAGDVAERLVDEQNKLKMNTSSSILEEEETEEIKSAERELEDSEYEYGEMQRSLASSRAELQYINADIDAYEYRLERAKRHATFVESEPEKKKAQDTIDKLESELNHYKEEKKKVEAEIKDFEEELQKANDIVSTSSKKLEDARTDRLNKIEEEQRKKIEDAKNNVLYLKTKAGFVSLNAAEILDNLISDYESGVANEREVNYRVNQIREALMSDGLMDTVNAYEGQEANIVSEQIDDYDTRISDLENKITTDSNYVMPENEYGLKLAELKTTKRKMQNNLSAQNRRYQTNLDRIESLRAQARDIEHLDETHSQQLLDEVKKIEERNEGIQSRMDTRRENIGTIEDEITDLQFSHNRPNQVLIGKDREELESLRTARERMVYLDRLHSISLEDKMNTLLLGTGSKLDSLTSKVEKTPVVVSPGELNKDDMNLDEGLVVPTIEEKDKDLGPNPSSLIPPVIDGADALGLGKEPSMGDAEEKKPFPGLDDEAKLPFPEVDTSELDATEEKDDEDDLVPIVAVKPPKPKLKEKIKKIIKVAIATLAVMCLGSGIYAHVKTVEGVNLPNQSITDAIGISATEASLKTLGELMEKCMAVDGDLYTAETYNPMMEKVYHIEELLKGEMSEDTCKEETKELQELYDNLQLKKTDDKNHGSGTGNNGGNTDNGGGNTDSGDKEDDKKPDQPVTPDEPDVPVTPDEPVVPDEPDEPVVDPTEEHDNDPDKIYLAPGDSAGRDDGGTVDYDGNQRDEDGNIIGEADTTKTPGGYTEVPVSEIPEGNEEERIDVPTGNETTDTSDLTEDAKDELANQVQEDIDNGLIDGSGDFQWEGFFGGDTPTEVAVETQSVAPAVEAVVESPGPTL